MYEELVARVRYHIQKASFMGLKEAESTLLLDEAADAIGALSKFADAIPLSILRTIYGYCACTREKCSDECSTYRRYKPIPATNYDRIISKTPEELAGFFAPLSCPYALGGNVECIENKECKECWLGWLKQEADKKETEG